MSIRTSRTSERGRVTVDEVRCSGCGLCVRVCKGAPLAMDGRRVVVDQSRVFGCISCGQCMAVCPEDAITVEGRCLSAGDLLPLPPPNMRAGYDSLLALMLARRSVRDFADKEVPEDVLQRILEAVSTAPSGIPPSDVSVVVFHGRDRVRALALDGVEEMRRWARFMNRRTLAVAGPLMPAAMRETMGSFLVPAVEVIVQSAEKGRDWLLYDAPLALFFHDNGYSDPADAHVAATYAMLAGESLGLGTCMLGLAPMLFRYGKGLRRKYGIPDSARNGLVVIFGYPAFAFRGSIRRTLASVRYAD